MPETNENLLKKDLILFILSDLKKTAFICLFVQLSSVHPVHPKPFITRARANSFLY